MVGSLYIYQFTATPVGRKVMSCISSTPMSATLFLILTLLGPVFHV